MSKPPFPLIPEDSPQRRSALLPALVTTACLFLLLGGSIFGFLSTCKIEGRDPWNDFFSGTSVLLAVLFVAALVWSVITAIVRGKENS
jgi:hypothetical protein